MKYNCQTKEKTKVPFSGTFSKSGKRTLKFTIFLRVLF